MFLRRQLIGLRSGLTPVIENCEPNFRFGSILLKNSNFVVDHNSRGRGRAPRTMRWGFSRETSFAACRLRMRLDTTIMSGKHPPRAKSGFSSPLIFRLFQQYRSNHAIRPEPGESPLPLPFTRKQPFRFRPIPVIDGERWNGSSRFLSRSQFLRQQAAFEKKGAMGPAERLTFFVCCDHCELAMATLGFICLA